MAVTAIHPGEHLAEELKALEYERGRTRAPARRADKSDHANSEWNTCDHWRHRTAPRSFLWYEC